MKLLTTVVLLFFVGGCEPAPATAPHPETTSPVQAPDHGAPATKASAAASPPADAGPEWVGLIDTKESDDPNAPSAPWRKERDAGPPDAAAPKQ